MIETVNKNYQLDGCKEKPIAIFFQRCELIATLVHSDILSGKLILTKIRQVDENGELKRWLHTISDNDNLDIGLEQNKIFWQPSEDMIAKYEQEFPG